MGENIAAMGKSCESGTFHTHAGDHTEELLSGKVERSTAVVESRNDCSWGVEIPGGTVECHRVAKIVAVGLVFVACFKATSNIFHCDIRPTFLLCSPTTCSTEDVGGEHAHMKNDLDILAVADSEEVHSSVSLVDARSNAGLRNISVESMV